MVQFYKEDLLEIQMDLDGISNLLVALETSEVSTKEDVGIYRALRNSIDFTKGRLDELIQNVEEVSFDANKI